MGEEEKKSEETRTEEPKKEEAKPVEKPVEEKKSEEPKVEDVPPPPPEIVLKVFMHCEGCARKVRRSLKGFPGVEEIITDTKSHKVVVKGEKADPLKVLERVQTKSHRKVELLSPIPKPLPQEETKPPQEEKPKPEEKKPEAQIVTVVLKVHMHCEACSLEIKRRILKMKGVESAESDLKNSVVTVKGAYEPAKLVDYVYKRTGRQAVIVKQEPSLEEKKTEEEPKQEVAAAEGAKKEENKAEEQGGDENNKEEKKSENAEEKEQTKKPEEEVKEKEKEEGEEEETEETKVGEVMNKNEYYYYPPRSGVELLCTYPSSSYYHYSYPYSYPPPPNSTYPGYPPAAPPQMFSDENPNACTVM